MNTTHYDSIEAWKPEPTLLGFDYIDRELAATAVRAMTFAEFDAACARLADDCRPSDASPQRLAESVSIALTQAGPEAWTVELTVDETLRYITSRMPTRREALLWAVDWIERDEAARALGRVGGRMTITEYP